jgi:hypothetical protein
MERLTEEDVRRIAREEALKVLAEFDSSFAPSEDTDGS